MKSWEGTCILHVDLDAFFASVEQLDHPEYRGKPVIVGGLPGERRSVVSTASYEARKYGVHSAMPVATAYRLCPQGIYLHGHFKRYHEKSQEVMNILNEYSPDVQQVSVDEAFIDLTGTQRLFGDSEKTAERLKQQIKAETGLTVSAGIGPNHYIAKIASDLKKPDGLCVVRPGQEEQFMDSLPLAKLWGAGSKTQIKMQEAGFRTVADLRSRSLNLLRTIFGDAGGSFLYRACRGQETESTPVHSHSLSVERTFAYDLTDRYVIETILMELAHTVMFRLLKENLCSRTVVLKLRYEDFTTVSIRETSEIRIMTTDDLFTRSCSLLEKKYDASRGIRLIGLGVQNTRSSTAFRQQELFDFGDKKKQQVEKAILNLEKKHPDVSVRKARLLDKNKLHGILLLGSFLFAMLSASGSLSAEETTETTASGAGSITFDTDLPPLETESPSSLFNYTINDTNVEFLADGYWESKIKNTVSASFGFGNPFALSIGTPVITQDVDLSLWFLLNKQWFFEADFADGFDKNTIAAGYYGDGYLKEAKISNRNIVFPSTYSINNIGRNIGGGDNQAPGISAHFEGNGKWAADAVLRYDMTETKEKLYYGKNSVSKTTLGIGSWMTGHEYVLPSKTVTAAVNAVYVENSSGSYTDRQGRTYKKLSSSDYLILASRCEIILSDDAGAAVSDGVVPAVAVSFDDSAGTIATLRSELGTYGTKDDPGDGFLGDIQSFFGENADEDDEVKKPNVASYSYGGISSDGTRPAPDATGAETDGFFSTINSSTILFLQHPAGFSPFEAAYLYDCGTASVDDVQVISSSSESTSKIYTAAVTDDDTAFVSDDFFSDSHSYVELYQTDNTYTASNAAVNSSVRYPAADSFPGFYLGGSTSGDLVLQIRTYTAVSRFDIGTDAVQGTVRVYKNNVLDAGATYNEEDGTVSLSSSVSSTDRIRIVWNEDSTSNDSGAITAAAGVRWNFTPGFSTDLSLAARWTYSPNLSYVDADTSAPGYATIAAGTSYTKENFSISNTAAVSIDDDNTTGKYRILGMDDDVPDTVYLESDAGVDLPSDFAPCLNPRPESGGTAVLLDTGYDGSVTAEDGENDSNISGYRIPVSWNFSSWSGQTSDEYVWAATALDLGSSASYLSSGTQFSIALKTADAGVQNYDVYLQLGVSADDDFTVEDAETIPTWKISDDTADDVTAAFDVTSYPSATKGWQTVTVKLTDIDRARFTEYHDARIIIVAADVDDANEKGTVYAGPYEIVTQDVFTSAADDMSVQTGQRKDAALTGVDDFNTGTNKVEKLTWENESDDDFTILVSRYFDEVDLSSYQTLNLFFRYAPDGSDITTGVTSEDAGLTIILDRDAEGIADSGKTAVRAVITGEALKNLASSTTWHELTINLDDSTLSIDDAELSSGSYSLYLRKSIVPVRLKMILNTAPDGTAYTSGEFSFDELNLSGIDPYVTVQNKTSVTTKVPGTLAGIGNFPLVKDVSFSANGEGTAVTTTGDDVTTDVSFTGDSSFSATLATLAVAGTVAHTQDSDLAVSGAGHSIATTIPILGILSGAESFQFDNDSESTENSNSLSLNLHKILIPLVVAASASATSDSWSVKQQEKATGNFNLNTNLFGYTLKTEAKTEQKLLPSTDGVEIPDSENWLQSLTDSTKLAFSKGSSAASKRKLSGTVTNEFTLPFAQLRPQLKVSTNETYKSSTSVLYTDATTITTTIPFKIGRHTFSLSWEKEGGGVQSTSSGGDYATDIETLSDTLASRDWFFHACPFYDLFSTKLSDAVLADTSMDEDSTDSLYYASEYSTSWKRPIFSGIQDLWIPSSAEFKLERDIRTAYSVSDIYQFKSTLGYTAFNIFGTESRLKLADWYRQDEFIGSSGLTVKIPHDEPSDYSLVLTGYLQSNFYLNDTDVLKLGAEVSFETEDDCSGTFTFVWKRKSVQSPVIGLVQLFKPDLDSRGFVLTRTDSTNAEFSRSTSSSTTDSTVTKKQSYSFTHLVEAQVTHYVTLDASLAGTYSLTWDSTVSVSLTASLGGKLQF